MDTTTEILRRAMVPGIVTSAPHLIPADATKAEIHLTYNSTTRNATWGLKLTAEIADRIDGLRQQLPAGVSFAGPLEETDDPYWETDLPTIRGKYLWVTLHPSVTALNFGLELITGAQPT